MHFTNSVTKRVKLVPEMRLTSLRDRWNGTSQTVSNDTSLDYYHFFLSGFSFTKIHDAQ